MFSIYGVMVGVIFGVILGNIAMGVALGFFGGTMYELFFKDSKEE